MSVFNISTRYANALLGLAESKNNLQKISDDAEFVYNTFNHSKELRKILSNPIIGVDKKNAILSDLFKNNIDADSYNFIMFVVDKNRVEYIFDIMKRFMELRDIKLGFVNVEIKSAVELSSDQKSELLKKLKEFTGKEIRFVYKLDENLLGGFIAKIGDTVMDASIISQLKSLREKFSEDYSLLNLN